MTRTGRALTVVLFASALAALLFYHYGRSFWVPAYQRAAGMKTVESVIQTCGPGAERNLRPAFKAAGVAYPPKAATLLATKEERRLELWARGDGAYSFIKDYAVQAASGGPGPKLREGDKQVPEGFYRIIGLNPNSSYHLSMKLDYPNAFDWEKAREEGRDEPGSNIFIHGKDRSIGCIAVGDGAIEELFTLVHRTGLENVRVVIAPRDPRLHRLEAPAGAPDWLPGLYDQIAHAFSSYRRNAKETS